MDQVTILTTSQKFWVHSNLSCSAIQVLANKIIAVIKENFPVYKANDSSGN